MRRLLIAAALPLVAAMASTDWQADLYVQIQREHNCEPGFLSAVEVKQVEGREVVFARVHCHDGRAFDAMRNDPARPFRISECNVRAC